MLQSGEVTQTTYLCSPAPKRIFVTITTVSNGSFSGVFGADGICQGRATAAGLSGTYLAWIGDQVTSAPASRFAKSVTPYTLVDGTTVAGNWTGLTSGTLQHAVNMTELGGAASGPVWTDVSGDGTFNVNIWQCNGWTAFTSGPYYGAVGDPTSTTASWTSNGFQSCGNAAHLYCVEQ